MSRQGGILVVDWKLNKLVEGHIAFGGHWTATIILSYLELESLDLAEESRPSKLDLLLLEESPRPLKLELILLASLDVLL